MRFPFSWPLWLVSIGAAFGLGWFLHGLRALDSQQSVSTTHTHGPSASVLPPPSARQTDHASSEPTEELLTEVDSPEPLSPEAMRESMAAMIAEKDPLRKVALFQALLSKIDADNAEEAVLALHEADPTGRQHRDEMQLLMHAWGRVGSASGIDALLQLSDVLGASSMNEKKDKRGYTDGLYHYLTGWGAENADAAGRWTSNLDTRKERGIYTRAVVEGLLTKSTDEALSYVLAMPESETYRGQLLADIAANMQLTQEAAMSWVDSLPSDLQDEAVSGIVRKLAKEDPAIALDLANDRPESADTGAVRHAMALWTKTDAHAASEFLASMEESKIRDQAVGSFAQQLVSEDPEAAAAWASSIENAKVRSKAVSQVAKQWSRYDAASAEAWLAEQPPLRDKTKAKSKANKGERRKRKG